MSDIRRTGPLVPALVSAVAGTVFIATGQIVGVPALAWGAPVCFAIGLVASAVRYQNTIRAVSTALEAPGRTTKLRSLGLDSLAEQIERLTLTVSQQARDVRDQNRTLTLLLDNLADGVIATDRSGAILTLNRSACRLLGAEPARLLGARVQSVLRHAALHEALDQALSGDPDPAQTLELGQHVPGSGRRELLVRVAGVRGPDDVLMAGLLVLRDVTDMRRLEQLRRDFVANVSHELKTPVTSIRGAAETLASGALSDRDAAPRFVAMIERQAARLQQIIEDLLHLARIERIEEAGEALANECVDVRELIRRAAEDAAGELERYGRTLHVQAEVGLCVRGDPGLLEQALVNLLSNAARYGGDDPTVQIRAAGQGSDGMVRIEVVDRGPGIPVEHQARLFERFYRVDRSRSREVGGTGLGLAIVKHIAVLHQGRVGVRSSEGEGSTFWIELPGAGDVENCSAAEQAVSAD